MPLHLAWSRAQHLEHAPKVFHYMWIVSSVALVVVVLLCLKKCVQTAAAAYRSRFRRQHVFLPRLQEAEISLTLTPIFFAWVGWASIFEIQTAGVMTFLISIVTAGMLTATRDLLLAALGEEPGVKELLKTAAPQAWWKTLPCCCLAGVCLTGEPEPLRPRHLRFGKYMVDFFVMVNLINALTQLIAFSSVQRVEWKDGWCVTDLADQDNITKFLAQVQGLASPFAMFGVSVMAKGVVACLGEEDHLQMNTKGNMAGTISLFTGLGPLVAGHFARGYESPTLGPGDTLIGAAVGCPVYDKEVMTTMWFAAALPVLMLPFALQLQGLVQSDDAKMAHELRIEQRQKLLTAESCVEAA